MPCNLAQGVPKQCHPSAQLWCHITEDPLSVSSEVFMVATFKILVFCDVMLHHWWADPASNMFLQNTGSQDAWAHPMAWVGRTCKQHVPSKHRMPGLTQWHGWADPVSNMFLQNTRCLGSPNGMAAHPRQLEYLRNVIFMYKLSAHYWCIST